MNKKCRALIITFFLLVADSATIYAQLQTALVVNEKSGAKSSFPLTNLSKLTFNSGNVIINKKDGNINGFVMSNVLYFDFSGTTSLSQINSMTNNMVLYPNPVRDMLQVRYESGSDENVQIRVFDIQGKTIILENMKTQTGANYINIPFDSFQRGLYFCQLQNGLKSEIAKFIKN